MTERLAESRQSRHSHSYSRPPSSLGRTGSALGSHAPSTSTYGLGPNTPRSSAARFGGLQEKELQKITSSIRAAKTTALVNKPIKGRVSKVQEEADFSSANHNYREPAPAGSFITGNESSFSRAPLSSRMPPPSPHRATIAAATGAARRARSSAAPQQDSDGEEVPVERSYRRTGKEQEQSDDELEEEVLSDVMSEGQSRRVQGLDKESLAGLTSELQEAIIVEDLLYVLMGIEGQYIEYDPAYEPEDDFERLQGAQFVIDSQLEPPLAALVQRHLPLATFYTSIQSFVEQYSVLEHGVINHALCAAIREMLRDYLILLAQLEHQFLTSPTFTLQSLWFYLSPTLHTLSLLHSLTADLVALHVPAPAETSSEDGSDDDDDDDDDDDVPAGMKDILAEMKGAAAGVKAAQAADGAGGPGWQGGIAKGGEVLYVLADKLERTSGDPAARELYSTLLLRASQPYVAILMGWISTGHLADPWDEFIVREGKGITRGGLDMDYTDEYWDRRYTLRDKGARKGIPGVRGDGPRARGLAGGAVVPAFLEPWRTKILLAGKYLNVIRECGIEIVVPADLTGRSAVGLGGSELVAMNEQAFFDRIDQAYTYANQTLLKLLLEDQHLVSRLRSIKQYFFIDHGDAFTNFLDLAKYELSKPRKHANETKLQSLLDLALRHPSSASALDPFKEDLKVQLGNTTLTEWLVKVNKVNGAFGSDDQGGDGFATPADDGRPAARSAEEEKAFTGYDAFTLDYAVRFPLSLVISRKTILRYQLLFRHLLQLKHLERALTDTWTEHHKSPVWRNRSPYKELEQWKARVMGLRARMLAFVQQMYGFAVSGVLEINWRALEAKLEKVGTVDQLLRDHVDFLDTCLKECLLTNEKLLTLHEKLLKVCKLFASYTSSLTKAIVQAIDKADAAGGQFDHRAFAKQWALLDKFEQNYNHHAKIHLERLNYHASREQAALLPLVVRLSSLKVPGIP